MSGFEVNPTGLHGASPQFSTVNDKLRDIHTELVAQLDSAGDCWGHDDAGRSFENKYVSPAVTVLKQMNAVFGGIGSTELAIGIWAKNYLNADGSVRQGFSTLAR